MEPKPLLLGRVETLSDFVNQRFDVVAFDEMCVCPQFPMYSSRIGDNARLLTGSPYLSHPLVSFVRYDTGIDYDHVPRALATGIEPFAWGINDFYVSEAGSCELHQKEHLMVFIVLDDEDRYV